ncbi:MAG: MATE family efflux transporter, partial [Symbiobacteriaceae bacterium]|nr:MATE family efflux transporter [Symbiobacteriaceae bacterium]
MARQLEERPGFSYLRTISLLTLLTFISKLVGLFRESLIAWNFGDGAPVAALSLAMGITNTVFGVLTATVSVAALPLYSELKARVSRAEAQRFLGNLLTILIIGAACLTLVFWLGAEPLTKLFAGGLDKEAFDLTVEMLRITLFAVYFQLASAVLTVFMQSDRRLVQILLANMSFNIAHIACTLLAVRFGPTWLARSAVLGAMLTTGMLALMARFYGFHWNIKIDLKDPWLRRVLVIMLP